MSFIRVSSLVLLILWAAIGPLENWNLYYPSEAAYPKNPLRALKEQPIPNLEDVYFTSSDGVRLNGWFVPASDRTKPTILLAHGNGGNLGDHTGVIRMFTRRGYGFLAFDYRGYGKSESSPSEQGIYKDITAASQYLSQVRHIPPQRQIALGGSLGSAVVIDAATHIPFRAVIAYSTLTSAPAVAEHLRDNGSMAWLKVLPLQLVMKQTYNSLGKIDRVHVPLLVLHGDHDRLMPVSMPKALYQRAGSAHKKLLIIPGAGHESVIFQGEDQMFEQLNQLLAETSPKLAYTPALHR